MERGDGGGTWLKEKKKRGESVKQWFGIKKGGVEVGETGNYFFLFFFLVSKDERHRKTGINPMAKHPGPCLPSSELLVGTTRKIWSRKKEKKKKILFFFFSFFFLSGVFFYFILTSMQRSGIKISHQESTRHPLNLSAVDTSSQDRVITLRVTSGRHTKLQIIY